MKKTLLIILALLLIPIRLTALASEGTEEGEGFSVEEMPEYGEADGIIFLQEDDLATDPTVTMPPPDPTAVPTPAPGEAVTKEHDPEQLAPEDPTEEGESDAVAPSPAPEEEPELSKQHNLPVVIIAAALALGALVYLIVKKPKAAKRNDR